MNAAEITDKLGLHSLRQRAWVSKVSDSESDDKSTDNEHSTSNPLAPPLVTVSTRGWNG